MPSAAARDTTVATHRRSASRAIATALPLVVVGVAAVALGAGARRGWLTVPGLTPRSAGLSAAEAREVAARAAAALDARGLRLTLPPHYAWTMRPREAGLGVSVAVSATDQAAASVTGVVDTHELRTVLRRAAHAYNREPRNARLAVASLTQFSVRPGLEGRTVDLDASEAAVRQAWTAAVSAAADAAARAPQAAAAAPAGAAGPAPDAHSADPNAGLRAAAQPVDVPLVARTSEPAVTEAALRGIDGELGHYTTHFGGTGASRGSNIALAASRINGTVIAPGQVFSYNQVVGHRSARAGFREAPVIIHGELVPGVGGGVCQVSSTLYNAVLLSDLGIVQRSHHAFPVHYLPAGRDATVVDGSIDFKFRNTTDAPIYVIGAARHGRLTFRILGHTTPGQTVGIELVGHTVQPAGVIARPDRSLRAGRRVVDVPGHNGHRVTVYRVVRINGAVVHRELLSRDRYRPFPAQVRIGTRVVPPKLAAPPASPAGPVLPGAPPRQPPPAR